MKNKLKLKKKKMRTNNKKKSRLLEIFTLAYFVVENVRLDSALVKLNCSNY